MCRPEWQPLERPFMQRKHTEQAMVVAWQISQSKKFQEAAGHRKHLSGVHMVVVAVAWQQQQQHSHHCTVVGVVAVVERHVVDAVGQL